MAFKKLKPVKDKARKIPGLEHKVLTLEEIKKRKLEATLLAKLKLNQKEETDGKKRTDSLE